MVSTTATGVQRCQGQWEDYTKILLSGHKEGHEALQCQKLAAPGTGIAERFNEVWAPFVSFKCSESRTHVDLFKWLGARIVMVSIS